MFTLGLEFNLSRIKGLGEVVLLGSFIQIILTIILGLIIFPFLGFDLFNSLFLGSVLSLSSTAIVVKILSDKGQIDSLSGEISVGWLLMQDLFTLPLIIILPAVGLSIVSGSGMFWSVLAFAKALSISIGLGIVLFAIGRYVLGPLFAKIAESGVREFLLLIVFVFCLLLSYTAMMLGLSFAIGAFIGGVLLSTTLTNKAIFSEIRPLRDLFSIVFFVSLGFLLKSDFIISHFSEIFFLAILVIFFKFLVSSVIVFIFGYHSKIAFNVGISLTSVGEFAFVIAILGISSHIITEQTYLIILSVASFSLLLSSPLLSSGDKIYTGSRSFLKKNFPSLGAYFHRLDSHIFSEGKSYQDHVVIVGHGRVGQYIAGAMATLGIPYVVIDYSMQTVRVLVAAKKEAIYGDSSDIDILNAASLAKAYALVIAIPDRGARNIILSHARSLNRDILILCRVHKMEEKKNLTAIGVYSLIQPEFEASLEMTRRLLFRFGYDGNSIENVLDNLRQEHGF